MPYGNIFMTSDYATALKETQRDYAGRKTWSEMYLKTDLAAKQAEAAVKYDYAKDIAEAYSASQQNIASIYGSNYGHGYKQAAVDELNASLQEAYDSYKKAYQEGIADVQQGSAETKNQITSLLEQQAEYTSMYEQAHVDYAKYLFDKLETGEFTVDKLDEKGGILEKGDLPADLFSRPGWQRLVKTDEQGNLVFKSEQELRDIMYDEQGRLTLQALDLYDFVENDLATEGGRYTFGKYLSEQDEANKTNLLEWATSYNPYDYTSPTNAAQFKELVGLSPDDDKYEFIESFGRMTDEEVDGYIGNITTKVDKFANSDFTNMSNEQIKKVYEDFSSELTNFANKLGIDVNTEDILNTLSDYSSDKDMLSSLKTYERNQFLIGIVGGTGGGAITGASVGGGVGAVIGAIIGFIAGVVDVAVRTDAISDEIEDREAKMKEREATLNKYVKEQMLNTMAEVVNIAKQNRTNYQKQYK